MDNDTTFNQVKEALEIASRIESLKQHIHQRMQDMTFKDDAAYRVMTCDAEEYVALDRLLRILCEITSNSSDNWKGTKIRDCVGDLERYVL